MGLTAFSNADLNRALYLVKFSEKIPGRFVENQHNKSSLVKVITLKSFIKDYQIDSVDFLKCDCEGAEYEIFANLEACVFEKIKVISLEFHDLKNANFSGLRLLDLFKKRGYESLAFQYLPSRMGLNYGRLVVRKP